MMGVQIPQEILDFAQDQLASAREQTKNAKSRLEEVEKIEKVWDDFVKYASCS